MIRFYPKLLLLTILLCAVTGLVTRNLMLVKNLGVLRSQSLSRRPLSTRSYRSKLFSGLNPVTGQAAAVPRIGSYDNFVAKWQARGDHYVSYANLDNLNKNLITYHEGRSGSEKKDVLTELMLTYFARFHNIIREEYQHEKKLVEERIRSWSAARLIREGYALQDLSALPKGHLYQDKVFRFQIGRGEPLPFHRFGVGDSVRITLSKTGDPLDDDSISGIVLDKRSRFLDVCVSEEHAQRIDRARLYRLDTFVNRVPYDRMIEALQLFLSPTADMPLSRAIRDLLLYSYPNSMIRLANSAGGLKMALPVVDLQQNSRAFSSRADVAAVPTVKIAVETERKAAAANKKKSPQATTAAEDEDTRWDVTVSSPSTQLNQRISSTAPAVLGTKQSPVSLGATFDDEKSSKPVVRSLTVAEVLANARRSEIDFSQRFNISTVSIRDVSAAGADPSSPVFMTNSRLRKMAGSFTLNPASSVIPFTPKEVAAVVARVGAANDLNPSQELALNEAITRPLSLIQGPPGTGKTKTACSIIAAIVLLKEERMREGGALARGQKSNKVLACAHSNVATDNLLEGLLQQGVRCVRLGRPTNVRTALWNHTIDSRLQQEEAWVKSQASVDASLKQVKQLQVEGADTEFNLGAAQRELTLARKRLEKVEAQCVTKILNEAEVVVSTCIGAGSDILKTFSQAEGARFSTVLIDEAAQCTEPAFLPACTHGCERLVLIGDQNQLPPVVISSVALERGLGVSLFTRLAAGGLVPALLNEQYRMHPKIAEFSSNQFYSGKVQSRVEPSDRPIPKGFRWPNPRIPVAFVDISPAKVQEFRDALETSNLGSGLGIAVPLSGGFECISNSSQLSYYNDAEAEVVRNVLARLIDGGVSLGSIGVISPYSAQVRCLSERLRREGWVESLVGTGESGEAAYVNGAATTNKKRLLKINTDSELLPTPDDSIASSVTIREEMRDFKKRMQALQTGRENELDLLQRSLQQRGAPDMEPESALYRVEEEVKKASEPPGNYTDAILRGSGLGKDQVEIRSVDGYQGREKEVIVISTVRSNRQGRVGFLKDWRRLNVAITRARSGLVVVGDSRTLRCERHWSAFLRWCEEEGCVVGGEVDAEDILALYSSASRGGEIGVSKEGLKN